jgi:hypothetical protein
LGRGRGTFFIAVYSLTISLMENYRSSPSYFPTFNKLITQYYTALDRFPALVGQLSFYIIMEIMFAMFSVSGIIDFSYRFLLTFPFLGLFFGVFIYPNMPIIIFLAVVFFTSVILNKIVLVFFPDIRTSRTKLLATSLIIGLPSFCLVNIFFAHIILIGSP